MANLFSNIDFGNNTRPFQSGGPSGRGAYSGRANTFYNLGPGSRAANQTITLPSCTFGPLLTFVLKSRSGSNVSDGCDGRHSCLLLSALHSPAVLSDLYW